MRQQHVEENPWSRSTGSLIVPGVDHTIPRTANAYGNQVFRGTGEKSNSLVKRLWLEIENRDRGCVNHSDNMHECTNID
jgi:hypothetical protein